MFVCDENAHVCSMLVLRMLVLVAHPIRETPVQMTHAMCSVLFLQKRLVCSHALLFTLRTAQKLFDSEHAL